MVATKEKQAVEFENSVADRDRIIRDYTSLAYKEILDRTRGFIDGSLWDKEDAFNAFVVRACLGYSAFCKARQEHCESEDHARKFTARWVKMCVRTGVNETRRMKAVCQVPRLILERGDAFRAAVRDIEAGGGVATVEAIAERINLPENQVRLIEAGQVYKDVIDGPVNAETVWREEQERAGDIDERIEEVKAAAKTVLSNEEYRIWRVHCLETSPNRKLWSRREFTRKFVLETVEKSMCKIRRSLAGQENSVAAN